MIPRELLEGRVEMSALDVARSSKATVLVRLTSRTKKGSPSYFSLIWKGGHGTMRTIHRRGDSRRRHLPASRDIL